MTYFKDWFNENYPDRADALDLLLQYKDAIYEFPANLVGTKDPDEFDILHLIDCLEPCNWLPQVEWRGRWLDLGSGPGLPGLPLAAVQPELSMTLLDSRAKPLHFLQEFLSSYKDLDITLVNGRAEDCGHNKAHRGKYDGVLARAVELLPVLVEITLPLLKVGGILVAYKGKKIEEAENALIKLRGEIVDSVNYKLPKLEHERSLVVIRKTGPTPKKYPRSVGTPRKFPL
jgi:16S rRNA (guanine527-N7)-methyltransferase